MKLKNKKTGKITEIEEVNLIVMSDERDCYESFADYQSLAELNADWEDYKPAEPLIKDEKIRKAVRAWAELIPSAQVRYDHSYGRFYTHSDYIQPYSISFPVILGLDETKYYTIAELCGEEEE